jgi:hypothetical protein
LVAVQVAVVRLVHTLLAVVVQVVSSRAQFICPLTKP